MDCKCGRPAIEGKVTCGRVECGSSTGNTQSLAEMAAIAGRARDALRPLSEATIRADERAKWVRVLRQSADTKRRWATELRADGSAEGREAATLHNREALEWNSIADIIEDNNERPCREGGLDEVDTRAVRVDEIERVDEPKAT